MDKIAIVGLPGAGKSTPAQQLGGLLNIEIIHLDRYFWQSDWKEKPRDVRIESSKELVRKERWIIEGIYLNSSEPCQDAADTIIFWILTPYAPPLPLWNVPYRRNPFFTSREEILAHLYAALKSSKVVGLTQAQAISGLGGIGKTQIAIEYAYRYRDRYQLSSG